MFYTKRLKRGPHEKLNHFSSLIQIPFIVQMNPERAGLLFMEDLEAPLPELPSPNNRVIKFCSSDFKYQIK